jgi:hypothetical protein
MARLVLIVGTLALSMVLFAGCGGRSDQEKVEASLHDYLVGLVPEEGPFPIGAGSPRVKDKSCRDRQIKDRRGYAIWVCVVRFGTLVQPVTVAVDDATQVVAAFPGVSQFRAEVRP